MMNLTIETLLTLLKKKGIDAEIQQETGQIVFAFQVDDEPFPLFIRIFDESQLLQILVFLPVQLKEGREGDMGRLLHWINQSLDLPGFGMEENSRSLFYRVMLPALGMSLDENLLEPFLGAVRVVSTTFLPPIRQLNEGESFEKVRKEVS
jgi:hypothetical protein